MTCLIFQYLLLCLHTAKVRGLIPSARTSAHTEQAEQGHKTAVLEPMATQAMGAGIGLAAELGALDRGGLYWEGLL